MNIDKKLHDVLLRIKEMLDFNHLSACNGICDYVRMELREYCGDINVLMDRLYVLFRQWPEYSGYKVFPIPSHRDDMSPHECYRYLPLWDKSNEYGQCRIRCLNWLINKTTQGE